MRRTAARTRAPEADPRRSLTAGLTAVALACAGCAALRSYDVELSDTIALASAGRLQAAIGSLESRGKASQNDLLHFMELGELQRLQGNLADSQAAWRKADAMVQAWESAARSDPAKLLAGAAAYAVNEKLRPYEGHDYEKVMLTTRIAMNQLAQGDWDNARVEIKKTHEREAVIANLRARQVEEVEREAKSRGAKTQYRELNGYPVATLDTPEVAALRNSYQSAFSHYLAGYVYEALGEPGLAAAGYRQAIELQPNQPLLERALESLDRPQADDGQTDLLVVIETGLAPGRQSRGFNLPIPSGNDLVWFPVSFPVLRSAEIGAMPESIDIDGNGTLAVTPLTSIDAMARRALQDDLPGIMLRGIIRSTVKAAMQKQAKKSDPQGLAELAVALGGLLTESADERGWRTLPAQISIARGRVTMGKQRLRIRTASGVDSVEVDLTGAHAVVSIRVLGGRVFMLPPSDETKIREARSTFSFAQALW
ncbi:MAG: COG3014 family protein [Burkholderiales bacterium]